MNDKVINDIAAVIHKTTGLPSFEERLCAYYILSTRFVSWINPFPVLCMLGAPGTGKTELLKTSAKLSKDGILFPGAKFSGPAFRDKLATAHDGTAVVDECESEDKGKNTIIEGYLSQRYSRDTATEEKKIPNKKTGEWKSITIEFYGPSIIGKRLPYRDGALGGRSIMVSTHASPRRDFITIDEVNMDEIMTIRAEIEDLHRDMGIGNFTPEKINAVIPSSIMLRVANTYRPIIALAKYFNDKEFLAGLWGQLSIASDDLISDQQYETGPLVVQALIGSLCTRGKYERRNVKLQGDLVKTIQVSFEVMLSPRQVAHILRGYGFELRKYGGPVVVFPNLKILHKVCRLIGYRDDMVETAYDEMMQKGGVEDGVVEDVNSAWATETRRPGEED